MFQIRSDLLPENSRLGSLRLSKVEIHRIGKMDAMVAENARVAQDQAVYRRKFDGLTARYDTVKERFDEVEREMATRIAKRKEAEAFLVECEKAPRLVTGLSEEMWYALANHATVHADGRITVTFRTGWRCREKLILRNDGENPRIAAWQQRIECSA